MLYTDSPVKYYGPVYGNRPYHREMGETPEDMARAVKYQEAKEAREGSTEYRPREIGEKPWEVPSRAQQAEYYSKAEAKVNGYNSYDSYETRPREIGERPEDVARSNRPQRPKTKDEMTEQERVLDMYA